MNTPVASDALRQHAADILRRARALPVGPERNDLRQLAIGPRWLDRKGSSRTHQQAKRLFDIRRAMPRE